MPDKTPSNFSLLPQVRTVLTSSYPELAAALQAAIAPVTAGHVRAIKAQLASAAVLNDDAARDDLPEVLGALAQALRHQGGLEGLALCGPAHAAAREGQGFTIEELFGEYVLVRRTLCTQVIAQLGRPLRDDEAIALHVGLDGVLAATTASFYAQREARLRLECTALSNFLASLAHDLRNEINGVMTSLQVLDEISEEVLRAAGAALDASLVGRMQDFMGDIRASREAMESSVRSMTRLLEFERLQMRVPLKVRAVALAQLMHGIVRSASRSLQERRPGGAARATEAVTVSCPAELIVTTDPDLLGTTLVNLVGNAIKHAPGSHVQFSALPLPDGRCRIEVQDGGPGIASERIPRLFERCERGAGAPGAGMGLFVARRAAELLGASISVTSELGRGSCFSIELPRDPPRE